MADYEDKKINNKQFTLFNNETGKSYQLPVIESKEDDSKEDTDSNSFTNIEFEDI